MQTAKQFEYALKLIGRHANTVVFNPDLGLAICLGCTDRHFWGNARPRKLDRIGHQVLQQNAQQVSFAGNRRQTASGNCCTGLLDGSHQIKLNLVRQCVQIHRLKRQRHVVEGDQLEQVVKQRLHAAAATKYALDEVAPCRIDQARIFLRQQRRKIDDRVDRFTQVMRQDMHKALLDECLFFQLRNRGSQLFPAFHQLGDIVHAHHDPDDIFVLVARRQVSAFHVAPAAAGKIKCAIEYDRFARERSIQHRPHRFLKYVITHQL